ncbi:unnamed protein product, partial [marine sediment metagenome]
SSFTMQMLDYSDGDMNHTYKRLPLKMDKAAYWSGYMRKGAAVTLDLEVGDVVLTGRYKNKRHVVDEIGTDDLGQPTVNGMKLLALRLEKKLPKSKWSKQSLDKSAAHPALPDLKQAKAYSDKGMYAAKLAILRKLVQQRRGEFDVDSQKDGILGLTHKPTKFQIHMPEAGFPKTAYKMPEHWIGVDLDGTLAKYTGWKGDTDIGAPIPKMVLRMKRWFRQGKKVKIFTARAHQMRGPAKKAIEDWCMKYLGRKLEITNVK